MDRVQQQLEMLTNALLDERELRERLQAEFQAEREATAQLAADLR